MKNKILFSLTILCCLFIATSLSAQATRTWVSGVGDDANPCSRTAPCKTFAGAISKTATCGEINAVDPGGFGAVTITKSITINGYAQLSGILNAGVTGVLVNLTGAADACDTVVLRWLDINGAASLGIAGVRDISSRVHSLHIEHIDINNQQRGVDINTNANGSKVFMKDVDIRHTTVHGIDVRPSAGQLVKLQLHDVRSRQSVGDGLRLGNNAQGTANQSQFEGNANGVNVVANSVTFMLAECILANNTNGLVNGSTAATALDGCTINSNNNGVLNNTGGTVVGFGNNALGFNVTDVNGAAIVTLGHP